MHPTAVKRPPKQGLLLEKVQHAATKTANSGLARVYYGVQYLDGKTSRWISADPAMAEYIPQAPVNDEAKKRNKNLPGMGGVFNYVNMHVYHYAGNNPVKLVDPDGEAIIATANAKKLFSRDSGHIRIANKTPLMYSSMIIYLGPRRRTSMELYDTITRNYTLSKIENNRKVMGPEFNKFLAVVNNYIEAKENNKDIVFNTTLIEGKLDDNNNPYYLLSMTIDGTTTDLFYFSSEEISSNRGRAKNDLLTRIGEFFAVFKDGTPEEWKPDASTKIQSDLF